jgi:ribonuclease H / adenosylcobalamin/alpha-ribazole phosphatase
MQNITMFTDGGSRNNPGISGIGGVIYEGDTRKVTVSEFIGIQTNNWAEYQGVIRALTRGIELGFTTRSVEVRLDSKLVQEQLSGNWKVKEPTLKPQWSRASTLADQYKSLSFVYIPREKNKEADALANEAMDRGQKGDPIQIL